MKLHFRQIPAEGQHLEGETDCPITDLEGQDVVRTGPLHYAIDVGTAEGALWASGVLHQPVTLRCVACLDSFDYTIAVPEFAFHTDLEGPELIDLTPYMREDILLNLPAHPHCDQHGGRVCRAAVPVTTDPVEAAARAEEKREADWSALDKLKNL